MGTRGKETLINQETPGGYKVKTLLDYLDSRFLNMNDLDRQHIESLLVYLIADKEQAQYSEGWIEGRRIGIDEGVRHASIERVGE